MPRCARAVSLTGYYHVFDRGNSKQIIFEDDPAVIVSYRTSRTGLRVIKWRCWLGALWTTTSI